MNNSQSTEIYQKDTKKKSHTADSEVRPGHLSRRDTPPAVEHMKLFSAVCLVTLEDYSDCFAALVTVGIGFTQKITENRADSTQQTGW